MSAVRIGLLVVLALCAWEAAARATAPSRAQPSAADVRARGLTFSPDFPAGDREWVLASLERARPEARALIDEIDGMTYVTAFREPDAWLSGQALTVSPHHYLLRINIAKLDGNRVADRDVIVIHELAHIVDFELIPDALRDRLAAQVPSSGTCIGDWGADCTSAKERFADTFAKWGLRGAVSAWGAGYGLPAPMSLEDWGAPLAAFAARLQAAR
jgi:hypothetical protein